MSSQVFDSQKMIDCSGQMPAPDRSDPSAATGMTAARSGGPAAAAAATSSAAGGAAGTHSAGSASTQAPICGLSSWETHDMTQTAA